jgi:very-short-patch-repair endonuclease
MGEVGGGMHRRTSLKTFLNAYRLRHNLTQAESRPWVLRSHRVNDVHFRRQHAIGPYIVDFCAPQKKLVVELDGGQHLDQQEYDAERTAFLESKGYQVLRFWNSDVINNLNGIVIIILQALSTK